MPMPAALATADPTEALVSWLTGFLTRIREALRREVPLQHVWIPLDLPPELAADALHCAVVTALVRTPGLHRSPPPELQRCVPGAGAAWRLGVWTRDPDGHASVDELQRHLTAELSRRGIPLADRNDLQET